MGFKTAAQLLGLAIILMLLNGCAINTYTDTIPVKGYLHTPEGKVKFKRVSSRLVKKLRLLGNRSLHTHNLIYAKGEKSQVIFNPLQDIHTLKILSAGDRKRLILDIDNAFYQVDDGPKQAWAIREYYRRIGTGRFVYEDRKHKYYATSANIHRVPELKDRETRLKHTYRYYLPYILDDREYLMDIRVKFRKNRDLEIEFGLPGSP